MMSFSRRGFAGLAGGRGCRTPHIGAQFVRDSVTVRATTCSNYYANIIIIIIHLSK